MPNSNPIVCFDLGGTLIDDPFDPVLRILAAGNDLKEINKNFANSKFLTAFFLHWRACNKRIHFSFASHFLQEEIWILTALRECGIRYSSTLPSLLAPRILAVYRDKALINISNQPQVPKIREFLQDLAGRGIRIIVASDDREFSTPTMLGAARLQDFVHQIYTSEGLAREVPGAEKPNDLFFLAFLKKEGVSRSQYGNVIYVGDSERNDIEPAKRLGLRTVRYINPLNAKDAVWLDATQTSAAKISVASHKEMIDATRVLIHQSS
jgi:FMN phosphatase YigB (HAD superfamily)